VLKSRFGKAVQTQPADRQSEAALEAGPFMNVEDMLRLLARYYFGAIALRDDLPIAREAIFRIWEISHGVPYIIQYISHHSFSRACAEKTIRVEESHVLAAHQELRHMKPELFLD
jgi:hypothetical protein